MWAGAVLGKRRGCWHVASTGTTWTSGVHVAWVAISEIAAIPPEVGDRSRPQVENRSPLPVG